MLRNTEGKPAQTFLLIQLNTSYQDHQTERENEREREKERDRQRYRERGRAKSVQIIFNSEIKRLNL